MRWKSIVVGLLLAIPLFVLAQDITGTIRGTARDASGAVVPNATVTVTNVDRNQAVRTVTTNSAGEYIAPMLPVGNYSVAVQASGFAKYTKTGIVVNVNDRLTVDAVLQAGGAQETVTVEANPVQVALSNASIESLVSGIQVKQLPLNNRNYEQLVTLQPGVTSSASDQIYVGTTNPTGGVNVVSFSINGNRNSQNNWTIDGADNVDHGSNLTLLVYPSVDAIDEFKVLRSNYSPEFGRSASGQINVVTRGGTSAFHGSAYEFFRNDVLNAENSYSKHYGIAKDVLRYNDFGGTFGGPLYIPGVYNTHKDKTFFFFSEEARRVHTPVKQTALVPTANERKGIFTNTVCVAVDATGNCLSQGKQFTGTVDPVAAAYLKDVFSKVPLPNGTTNPNELVTTMPGVFNFREEVFRVDHVINSKVAVMGRIINDSIPTEEPFGLFGPQSPIPGVANTKTDSPGRQLMGRMTIQASPTVFNEVGYAYSYGAITSDPTGLMSKKNSPDVASAAKLPFTSTLARIPNVWFDGLDQIAGYGEYRDYNRNHNLFDNLSWLHGKHSFKFGFTFNHYQKKENAAGDNVGNYTFDSTNAPKDGSDITTLEQSWANFLMGYVSGDFSQARVDTTADIRQNLWEFYAQDEYRIKSNLTLSYGVRYSLLRTPYSGGSTPLTSFDPSVYDPSKAPALTAAGTFAAGAPSEFNGIIIGDKNSPYGKYVTRQQNHNFAPRIGIAWDPTGKGKTSVRAGFGVFYDAVAAGLIEDNVFNNPPYLASADFGGGLFTSQVAGASASADRNPPSIWTTDPKWKTPYSQQWSLDFQQEMGHGWMVDIGYVGNKGTHLAGVQDINQVRPGAAQAAGLVAAGAVYDCTGPKSLGITCNNYSDAARILNKYRPYVGYGTIGQITPSFDSNYNALQASVNKKFSANATIGVAYTYSKDLTDNQSDRSTGLQDTYCRRCEYGLSQLDRRQVLTVNHVYELPWFQKQQGFTGHLLGGYQLSGILTVNSGLPLTVMANRNWGDPAALGLNIAGAPNNGRVATPRPNQVGNPNSGGKHSWDSWFNESAFAIPTTGGAVGTERRGAVTGPGLWRYDLSLSKYTKISERLNMQFRAEAFNLFNHTNFSSVSTSMPTSGHSSSSSFYNKITGTRDPRIVQLAMKLVF